MPISVDQELFKIGNVSFLIFECFVEIDKHFLFQRFSNFVSVHVTHCSCTEIVKFYNYFFLHKKRAFKSLKIHLKLHFVFICLIAFVLFRWIRVKRGFFVLIFLAFWYTHNRFEGSQNNWIRFLKSLNATIITLWAVYTKIFFCELLLWVDNNV